jgi:hypothetical protein
MAMEPIQLSLILPAPGKALDSAGLAGLGRPWEILETPAAASAETRNRTWREARGEWLLFLAGGHELPSLVPFTLADEVDCILGAAPPEVGIDFAMGPPFAIRRARLEELGGFAGLPDGMDDLELGLRVAAGGLRCLRTPHWPGAARGVAPTFDGALAVFVRHPLKGLLRWLCARIDPAGADPGAALAERFLRGFGEPVPASGRHSIPELAAHFAGRAQPPFLPVGEIVQLLETAVKQGLFWEGDAADPRLDRSHSGNWLNARTQYYEAMSDRHLLVRCPIPRRLEGAEAAPLSVDLRGRYDLEISPSALAGLRHPSLDLPLPVPCREQPEVSLSGFEPAGIEAWLAPDRTFLRIPLQDWKDRGIRIGYAVHCRVQEGAADGTLEIPVPGPLRLSQRYAERLDAMTAAIFQGRAEALEPRARARRIYDWMLDQVPFRLSDRVGLFALEARAGNCAHRARLFTLLCQRVGLPGRMRSGIPAVELQATGTTDGQRWAETEGLCQGQPLAHSWAEVFLEGSGWTPVDFVGPDSGARMLTPRNVLGEAARARLLALTPGLEDYGFGHVDPYRVHLGSALKPLAGLPVGLSVDLDAIAHAAWGCQHRFRCRLSGLPSTGPWPSGTVQGMEAGDACAS